MGRNQLLEIARQYGIVQVGLSQEHPTIWEILGDRNGQPKRDGTFAFTEDGAANADNLRSRAQPSPGVDATKDLVSAR